MLLGEFGDFLLILCLHISSLFLQSFSFCLEPHSSRLKIGLKLLYFLFVVFLHKVNIVLEFLLEFLDDFLVLILLLIELLVFLIVLSLFKILKVFTEFHFLVFNLLQEFPDFVPQFLLSFSTGTLRILKKTFQLFDLVIKRIDSLKMLLDVVSQLLDLVISCKDGV